VGKYAVHVPTIIAQYA